MESTLNYAVVVKEHIMGREKSRMKGLYMLWNMVDGREKTELYQAVSYTHLLPDGTGNGSGIPHDGGKYNISIIIHLLNFTAVSYTHLGPHRFLKIPIPSRLAALLKSTDSGGAFSPLRRCV